MKSTPPFANIPSFVPGRTWLSIKLSHGDVDPSCLLALACYRIYRLIKRYSINSRQFLHISSIMSRGKHLVYTSTPIIIK